MGTISVQYTNGLFGFCGTGNFDKFTLGGYEAWAERYDGEEGWDYIHLTVPVGDCEIWFRDADAWWEEYGDAAMEILDTIGIREK